MYSGHGQWPMFTLHGVSQSLSGRGEKTQVLCHLGRNSMKFFHLAMSEFKYASWRLLPIELGMGSANSSAKEHPLLLCTFSRTVG